MSLGGGVSKDEEMFPKFDYYIDESDPDIVVLRRQDGSFVAAFSARGATREGIVEAAKDDYRKVIEAHAGFMDLREEDNRQRSAKSSSGRSIESRTRRRLGAEGLRRGRGSG